MFELLGCQITVPPAHMSAIVRTESSSNPYAIGVVGHYLSRQPSSEAEALEVITQLQSDGHNYSEELLAGSKILKACYDKHQDWKKAYSCYYSGNPVTGFRHGYVQKVLKNLKKPLLTSTSVASYASLQPIKIIPRKSSKPAAATVTAASQVQPLSLK